MIPLSFKEFLIDIQKTLDDVTNVLIDEESKDYAACQFIMSGKKNLFRNAKKTPKKVGMFVTLWKRPTKDSEICPFDKTDNVDFVIVKSRDEYDDGYFVFPVDVFFKYGIFSKDQKDGKRAIRVYSPSHITQNLQSTKTQKWQKNYFVKRCDILNLWKIFK
ncbi:MAG: MepB family protein [Proteobacteria bacterium]|nr:MepB family protein [Pseudomonadota bacterium]